MTTPEPLHHRPLSSDEMAEVRTRAARAALDVPPGRTFEDWHGAATLDRARLLATIDALRTRPVDTAEPPTGFRPGMTFGNGGNVLPPLRPAEPDTLASQADGGPAQTGADLRVCEPPSAAPTPAEPGLREALTGLRDAVIAMKLAIPPATTLGEPWRPFLGKTGDVNLWLDVADAALATTPDTLDAAWASAVAADWVAYWKDKDHRYGRDPEAFLGERVLTEFGLRDAYLAARLREDRS